MPATLTRPKTAKRKATATQGLKRVATPKKTTATKKKTTPKKKKSLLDIAKELAKKPLFTIDEKDRDLVYGSNMMTRLLQEEEI